MDIIILDPKRRKSPEQQINHTRLLPGDLLLYAAHPDGGKKLIASGIRLFQRKDYGFDDARWHHVGMYVQGHVIVEAVRQTGVVVSPVDARFADHLVRVRRLRLSKGEYRKLGHLMSDRAKSLCGTPYDIRDVAWQSSGLPRNAHQGYVCSTLYIDVLEWAIDTLGERAPQLWDTVSQLRLLTKRGVVQLPALLSHSANFDDVAVGWL